MTHKWLWEAMRQRKWTLYESHVGWRMWLCMGWWTREYVGKSYTDSWQGDPELGMLHGDWWKHESNAARRLSTDESTSRALVVDAVHEPGAGDMADSMALGLVHK